MLRKITSTYIVLFLINSYETQATSTYIIFSLPHIKLKPLHPYICLSHYLMSSSRFNLHRPLKTSYQLKPLQPTSTSHSLPHVRLKPLQPTSPSPSIPHINSIQFNLPRPLITSYQPKPPQSTSPYLIERKEATNCITHL